MVRKAFFFFEFGALTALQVAGLLSFGWTAAAAFAQAAPAAARQEMPEAALHDPDIVQDFSATLPPSAPVPRYYTDYESPQRLRRSREEFDFYDSSAAAITAHRFYDHRQNNGRKGPAWLQEAVAGFARECVAKGGAIEAPGSSIYMLNASRLPRPSVESRLDICMRTPEVSLGTLVTISNKRLGSFAILVLGPGYAETPAGVAARQARTEAYRTDQARQLEARKNAQRAALPGWRRSIQQGTETNCGTVLRVNGDLIEVVYFRTREPKWYRRAELYPSGYDVDGWETCR